MYLSPKRIITVIHASFQALCKQKKYLNIYRYSAKMYFFIIHSTSSVFNFL